MNTEIKPIEELDFADLSWMWDREQARKRIVEALGWPGLAAYSLAVNPDADPCSADGYLGTIADIKTGPDGPSVIIVPQALEEAGRELSGLTGNLADQAQALLDYLKMKLERDMQTQVYEEVDSERDGQEPEIPALKLAGQAQAEQVISKLSAQGKLIPAWNTSSLARFAAGLSIENSLNSDHEDLSPFDYFCRLLETIPGIVPISECAVPVRQRDNSLEAQGRKIAQSLGNK